MLLLWQKTKNCFCRQFIIHYKADKKGQPWLNGRSPRPIDCEKSNSIFVPILPFQCSIIYAYTYYTYVVSSLLLLWSSILKCSLAQPYYLWFCGRLSDCKKQWRAMNHARSGWWLFLVLVFLLLTPASSFNNNSYKSIFCDVRYGYNEWIEKKMISRFLIEHYPNRYRILSTLIACDQPFKARLVKLFTGQIKNDKKAIDFW